MLSGAVAAGGYWLQAPISGRPMSIRTKVLVRKMFMRMFLWRVRRLSGADRWWPLPARPRRTGALVLA
jgi:hypothetical protein